jgi:hypothetical protein
MNILAGDHVHEQLAVMHTTKIIQSYTMPTCIIYTNWTIMHCTIIMDVKGPADYVSQCHDNNTSCYPTTTMPLEFCSLLYMDFHYIFLLWVSYKHTHSRTVIVTQKGSSSSHITPMMLIHDLVDSEKQELSYSEQRLKKYRQNKQMKLHSDTLSSSLD